jgi:hypothetical protein
MLESKWKEWFLPGNIKKGLFPEITFES